MSPVARMWAAVAAGLAVIAWAWHHGRFDGQSLIVESVIAATVLVLWRKERAEARRDSERWIR